MSRRRATLARLAGTLVLAGGAALAAGRPAHAGADAAKIPLDYRAYDGWNAIRGTVLSQDGRHAAYALVPEDGDPVLVVHDFTNGSDVKEPRGIDPAFTADGRFVVYAVRAPNAAIHKATREHAKPDAQPKNGLGILDLETGAAVSVDRVKTFAVPADRGADVLAYALESPLPAPSSSPLAASSGASVASPAPSASPDDLHAKESGTTFVIRVLGSDAQARIEHVTSYALAHDGGYVAYAVASKDGASDGLTVRAVSGAALPVVTSTTAPGHYANLTFAPRDERLAYLSDAATFAAAAPAYALYQIDFETRDDGPPHARVLASDPVHPPSTNGTLRYTKDGRRVFFGTVAAPTPVPSGTPDPMKVDIWNWQDLDLQSYQRKHADDERKRTYAAVAAAVGPPHAVQLATTTMREIVSGENPDFALGRDDRRYRMLQSWDADYADVYAVSLRDGGRRLLIAKQHGDVSLAPDGRFAVAYDRIARAWFAVNTADGKRTNLTAHLTPAFYDERDDHPEPPPPYGFAGWLDGGRAALVRDRYDVWAIDPRTGAARMLTGGLGRARKLVFEPQVTDPDADAFDPAKPILLHARDDVTKDQGLWSVSVTGPHAFVPQPIVMLPKAVAFVASARAADRYAVFEQTFSEMRNLWSAPALDAPLVRISDANPQRARYLWGDERLVSYRSAWGVPLQGILYTPDGFDAHRTYPMLVYFYERFSDSFHEMPFTTPAPNTSPTLVRYVSHGYVVFVPDVAYRTGHPGKSAYDCIMPAIDSIVKRGFVDPKRIGIAGHSWAAYQIAYLLTRTNRFRAAEAGAAVGNMTSAYGGIRLESGVVREFQYERGQSRIGATPWDRPDLYLENSALFHVRDIQTPYLTIANDQDGAVPQEQGIEFFTALRRLGKEAYLFSFDGEDHNLRGREQQKYWTVHLDEFFDHFLRGAPTPDWMANGVDYLHRGRRDVDRTLYGETW